MILVTGATGKLGRHVIQQLVQKVPANQIVAAVRDPGRAADLAKLGVHVRLADYDQPDTFASALAGVNKVLLISASELGRRLARHRAVIDAAKKAGVRLLVYTSILRAASSTLALAAEHKATEEAIRASGLPFVFLRNGWYIENYTENLGPVLAHGAVLGSSGDGRVAAATRADFAAAAVAASREPARRTGSTSSGATSRSRWRTSPPRSRGGPASPSSIRTCRRLTTGTCWSGQASRRRSPTCSWTRASASVEAGWTSRAET